MFSFVLPKRADSPFFFAHRHFQLPIERVEAGTVSVDRDYLLLRQADNMAKRLGNVTRELISVRALHTKRKCTRCSNDHCLTPSPSPRPKNAIESMNRAVHRIDSVASYSADWEKLPSRTPSA